MSTFLKFTVLSAFLYAFGATGTAYAKTYTCNASWYGPKFHGNQMANGERFNMHDPHVVAHKSLPFGTVLSVTNVRNGKKLRAVVKDRGPYVGERCLDLSKAGAAQLGFMGAGITTIKFEIIR